MKRGIIYGIIMIILFAFISINRYSEIKNERSLFDYFKETKSITDAEKLWLANHSPLIFGAVDNNAPFLETNESRTAKGFLVDYIDELSKELDTEIIIKLVKAEDLLSEANNGEIDFCALIPSLERDKYYEFTYPIFRVRGIALVSKDTENITLLKDLFNKKVAVRLGDYSEDFLAEVLETVNLIHTAYIQQSLLWVKNGDVDALAGDEPVVMHYVKALQMEDHYRIIDKPIYEKNYVFAVNESNTMLHSILNKGIYNLGHKNRVEDIQRKWFGLSISMTYENISDRITILVLILIMALSMIFYFFYASNKTLFKELEQRMEELSASRNDLQITFDGLTHYMLVIDQSLNILNINEAFCHFINENKSRIIGKYFMEFPALETFLLDCSDRIIMKTFMDGRHHNREFQYNAKIFEINTYPLKDRKHRIPKILVMIEDITKSRINERQLIQENKMAAIGQLAAGVAHEIRNPLVLIRNYCYVLKNNIDNNEGGIQKSIAKIEQAVAKASNIINNLLNFSKISSNRWETVNMRSFLDSIVGLQVNTLNKELINIRVICDKELMCHINIESIEIIIVNMISNAADAMPEGGIITLECVESNNTLKITCKDTGVGIPKENLHNIFDPFFTTKSMDKGTGLGLYITYNEVHKQGGDICVVSEVNKGTTFLITIPLKEVESNEQQK